MIIFFIVDTFHGVSGYFSFHSSEIAVWYYSVTDPSYALYRVHMRLIVGSILACRSGQNEMSMITIHFFGWFKCQIHVPYR